MFKKLPILGVFQIIIIWLLFNNVAYLAPSIWPSHVNWSIVTSGGDPVADSEERGLCVDLTRNANIFGSNDISSQADCLGPPPYYNPGSNGQPGATVQNTYSASIYYDDFNGDSNICTNISDDYIYFRIRLVGNPAQPVIPLGLTNDFWWYLLDITGDSVPEFYIRLDGNLSKPNENLDILWETSGDSDPTGEPVIVSYSNPLDSGLAQVIPTPDNGTVGDATEYFVEWQLPLTDFDNNIGVQQVCKGSTLNVLLVSTSANPNDPYQKDYMFDLLRPSDPLILSDNDYKVEKSVFNEVGNTVEYEVNINNSGNALTDLTFTDPLGGGTFEQDAYGVGSGIKVIIEGHTFNMSNSIDIPDSGGCFFDGCEADYTAGSVNFKLDWLYAKNSPSPLYDNVKIRYKITYPSAGDYFNQGYAEVNELPGKQYSDDISYDDGSDCTDLSGRNCNDGITDNDDFTIVSLDEYDYGDAPDPLYPTLLVSDGARHTIDNHYYLGTDLDSDLDGQPDVLALGDDASGIDDEDGVIFATPLIPSFSATIDVTASEIGFIDGWIDFNADGSWLTPGDQVMTSVPVVAGVNNLVISVPASAVAGPTYARFRYSTTGGLSVNGLAADGEVEDYYIDITASSSIGDFVWEDFDGNGVLNGADAGIDNVSLDLYQDDGDGIFEPGADDGIAVYTTMTSGGGNYDFTTLSPGSYWVDITDVNWILSDHIKTAGNPLPELITVGAGEDYNNADYGYYNSYTDSDSDGIINITECPGAPPFVGCPDTDLDGLPNYLDIDSDGDGIVDNIESQSESHYIAPTGIDSDGDTLDDAYDPDNGGLLIVPVDRDADSTPDYLDLDTDGDTVPDLIEGHDADFNGIADTVPTGIDSDNDGLDDAFDTLPIGDVLNEIGSNSPLQDYDADSIRDWRDIDDDNDLVLTIDEDYNSNGNPTDDDPDADGKAEYLDYNPMGYLYNYINGEIFLGATINVSGPGHVTMIDDGTNGYYKWDYDGTPGIYTMSVTYPAGWDQSVPCSETTPAFDPTGSPNPVILGNYEDSSNPGYLTSDTCTTYYLNFNFEANDPVILNNNIPVMQLAVKKRASSVEEEEVPQEEPKPSEEELVLNKDLCLQYNPERKVNFIDNSDWPKPYVDFLAKVFKKGDQKQYVISGDGSHLGEDEIDPTTIRPLDLTNRFETIKIALTSFCIPIYTTKERLAAIESPNVRPDLIDFPRILPDDHPYREWVSDDDLEFISNVIYKAYDLGIIDGRLKEDGSNFAEWDSLITRAEILKIFVNAADLYSIVNQLQEDERLALNDVQRFENYYVDANPDDWYFKYVPFVVKYKIVAEVCLPQDIVNKYGFENYTPEQEFRIRTMGSRYNCDELDDPVRFTFAKSSAVRAEVFALTSRMLYIASAIDHKNQYSQFNTENPDLIKLIFELLYDAERSEFLFSINDSKAFAEIIGKNDLSTKLNET